MFDCKAYDEPRKDFQRLFENVDTVKQVMKKEGNGLYQLVMIGDQLGQTKHGSVGDNLQHDLQAGC